MSIDTIDTNDMRDNAIGRVAKVVQGDGGKAGFDIPADIARLVAEERIDELTAALGARGLSQAAKAWRLARARRADRIDRIEDRRDHHH